jgi:hypothetical protein
VLLQQCAFETLERYGHRRFVRVERFLDLDDGENETDELSDRALSTEGSRVREVGYCPDFCRRRLRSVRFMRWRWRLSTFTLASVAGSRSGVATVRLVVLRLFMKDGKVS